MCMLKKKITTNARLNLLVYNFKQLHCNGIQSKEHKLNRINDSKIIKIKSNYSRTP